VPSGPLILASRSPQRRKILAAAGFDFEVAVADVDELKQGDPEPVALENARRKARAVAAQRPGDTVVGADTVVAVAGRLLPKPVSAEQAGEWLRALAGRTHRVVGGVCVAGPGGERCAVETTSVTFRALDDDEIAAYVATGEWRERAGAYAIQGAGGDLVERIDGSYENVVGLPLEALRRLLDGP
jgi:nucleoside triphosphate pyrophosphatase